ncbi:DNA-cytosine methyltransferase [hydrothermal vent metagenome]|uniref:DNA (cytosine-5-)-methyltransferase n=1 Tax=hydrothermal vent metagenome TaxID=652676 RepID=A0A3B0Y051_9ZZZZ
MKKNQTIKKNGRNKMQEITAVDLFCGAGGLTKGLEKSGIQVNLGVDIDPACEYPYSSNNSGVFIEQSITSLSGNDIQGYFKKGSIKLLAGCAPCQTFSTYNRKSNSTDERWWLLLEFGRLIKETLPELVTMENVPGLIEQDVFDAFRKGLIKSGYKVDYKVINCSKYGLPQNRRRLVLLASRIGEIRLLEPKEFTRKTHKTVKETIGNLEPIGAGEQLLADPLHKSAALSKLNLKRIKVSKPGGTWRDWPKNLVADCHKKQSGKTYVGVYGRMKWDEPSPAITTQFMGFGNGRFGHPKQHRGLSLREGAMLQGFPKSYKFVKKGEEPINKVIGRLVGNAVPVTLGHLIGKSIIKHVESWT